MMLGFSWVWVIGQEESNTHTHPDVAEVSSSKALKPCKLCEWICEGMLGSLFSTENVNYLKIIFT